ncbi:MAG: tetratricopeptide repeat protein [Planctomycetes bacterium]|nr:tetratricopeptide repeat protein [Planctomycetota bacterium]
MGDLQGSEKFASLREPLRRLDSVLNFARKLLRESGEIPPGLVEDFSEARKDIEKAFVFVFDQLDEKLQKLLRELIQVTKNITAKQIEVNANALSKKARSALNQLMIQGDGPLTLTDELGKVRFSDDDIKPDFDDAAPDRMFAAAAITPSAPAPRSGGLRRPLIAIVLIGVLALVALTAGYLAGPWSSSTDYDDGGNLIAGNTGGNRTGTPPGNEPVIDPDTPFDAEGAGYTSRLTPGSLATSLNPLEADPKNMPPGELIWLLLGYEELIHTLEPKRLKFPPEETRRRLRKFGDSAVAAQDQWIEQRQPLLDAFAAHVAREQQLALYPPETAGTKVLVSDVLYSVGGGQFSLVITLEVLAQSCNAPIRLIAPLGPDRPLLGVHTGAGMATYNGQTFGLRDGRQPVLLLAEMLVELSRQLRPTLDTSEARLLCSAVTHRHATLFTVEQAREALADFNVEWLTAPAEDAPARELLLHQVALTMQPVICETLLKPVANGDSNEALAVYRLASVVNDAERANRALLVLGERAAKGALLDGQPLPLVVADLLVSQGKQDEADKWFYRAMDEHPEDPRPVVRLALRRQGQVRFELCREAYTRGERSAGFLRVFATAAAEQRHDLLSLKILDELIALGDFDALDLQNAVLMCVSLGRTDWALERLTDNNDITSGEPALQRLELICELSVNGLSNKARQLAATWRARGETDPFVESLLKRYGG